MIRTAFIVFALTVGVVGCDPRNAGQHANQVPHQGNRIIPSPRAPVYYRQIGIGQPTIDLQPREVKVYPQPSPQP